MRTLKPFSKSFPVAIALAIFLITTPALFTQTTPRDYRFDGSISLPVLQNYLSRAIHMGRLGEGVGNTADNIRMVKSIPRSDNEPGGGRMKNQFLSSYYYGWEASQTLNRTGPANFLLAGGADSQTLNPY
ncbi:MAG: hypothetical protein WCO56_19935 [Verrucomicrobiota bacterium]